MTAMLRAIVADDEPIERQRLVRLLQAQSVHVVATCGDTDTTIEAIRLYAPDIVFLEIHKPDLDGFEILATLSATERPPVAIFVTAQREHALHAFEVHALDYLLKPVDAARLQDALQSVTLRGVRPRTSGRQIVALLEELTARERARGHARIVIRTPERAFFLRTDHIDWVEAAGKFVRLHTAKGTHALRQTLADLEQQLDDEQFVRISRSLIVNLDRIQEIQPWFQGDYVLILTDGTRLTSTRGYRDSMRRLLGKSA